MKQLQVCIFSALLFVSGCSGSNNAPPPASGQTVEYTTDLLMFDYPAGWQVVPQAMGEDQPIEAFIESASDEGSLLIRVQVRDDVDLIKYDLDQLRASGYTIDKVTPAPNIRVENQIGDGVDYIITKDSKKYQMLHLLVHFDVDHDVLFRMIASKRYWWSAMDGWKQILSSLAIGDLYQIEPSIAEPMVIDREIFSFQAPENWHLGEYKDSPFTNLEISAKQYSWFTTTIIDRDMSAQEELNMYLNHSIDDQLVSHTSLSSWMGLVGVGVQGQLRESLAGYQLFKALYVPLADGRLLVVKEYQVQSSAELTNPGFELIESTFELLAEPASNDSEVDP